MNTAAIETGHIRTLSRVMDEIRKIDSEMPTQMAHCLVLVALEPGITMKRMSEKLGLSQSSTSRNIAALGKQHRYGKPGYDLLAAKEDPVERRRKIVTLTAKGERVMRGIIEAMAN